MAYRQMEKDSIVEKVFVIFLKQVIVIKVIILFLQSLLKKHKVNIKQYGIHCQQPSVLQTITSD